MIKHIKKTALSLFLLLSSYSFSFATEFIEGFEDLPIIDGFVQEKNEDVAFGNEESRFIETYISGTDTSFNEVKIFYINTLPQMGWSILNNNVKIISFEREEEVLEIAVEDTEESKENNEILVRITLKSKGKENE